MLLETRQKGGKRTMNGKCETVSVNLVSGVADGLFGLSAVACALRVVGLGLSGDLRTVREKGRVSPPKRFATRRAIRGKR